MRARAVFALGALTVALAAGASRPASAVADADPASDVLLGSAAFFPYQPAVSSALQNQLLHELGQLHKRGLNLKVAIIDNPTDLGAIPNMFGRPQAYADFLEREISFNQPQPLLVVMPSGFGLAHAGSPSALNGLKPESKRQSNGLTASAILGVQRIAAASGKALSGQGAPSGGGSSSGTSPLITFGAPALLVLLGAAVAARVTRHRQDDA